MGGNHVRQLEQALRAGFRRGLAPADKGQVRRLNGRIHLGRRRLRNLQQGFTISRIEYRHQFAFTRH